MKTSRPDRVALWADELETTTAPQIREHLADGKGGFCCLGVACEVAIANGLDLKTSILTVLGKKTYGQEANNTSLPTEVIEWYGLEDNGLNNCDPIFLPNGAAGQIRYSASKLNDDEGYTFKEIATIIRKAL